VYFNPDSVTIPKKMIIFIIKNNYLSYFVMSGMYYKILHDCIILSQEDNISKKLKNEIDEYNNLFWGELRNDSLLKDLSNK